MDMNRKTYNAYEAIENALKNALRYEPMDPKRLMSINLIVEEIYLWLGYGKEKQDLRLFTRLVKVLEDAPVTGDRDADIPMLTKRVMNAIGRGGNAVNN